MLQNQYLLDTRRYSTLNASLVTQACTNTRCLLLSVRLSPLLCDTTASGCHVSLRLGTGTLATLVFAPKVWFRVHSIILARWISCEIVFPSVRSFCLEVMVVIRVSCCTLSRANFLQERFFRDEPPTINSIIPWAYSSRFLRWDAFRVVRW